MQGVGKSPKQDTPEALPGRWKRFRGCAPAVPRQPRSRAEIHRPDRMIFPRTIQKTRRSLLALRLRKRRARSKAHAKRLCNLCQTFSLKRVRVTPSCAAFKLVQNLILGFGAGFSGKLVPQVFNQLEALKFAKMFDGLQGGFHAKKFSTPQVNSRTCRQTRMNGENRTQPPAGLSTLN